MNSRSTPFALFAQIVFVALLALPSSAAWEDDEVDRRQLLDKIRGQIDADEWSKAAKTLDRAEELILERSRPLRDDPRSLAELAIYRAALAAQDGDRVGAEWFWYSAYHLHAPTAYGDWPDWGDTAAIFEGIEVRELRGEPPGVDLYSRPQDDPEFQMPKMPTSDMPDSLESSHDRKQVRAFNVEIYLDAEGRPHAPRFLGPPPHPMMLYAWMKQMYEGKWKPARYQGEPVAMLITIDQSIDQPRW